MLITDATMLMHNQTKMFVAARDASRQVALRQKTKDEAELHLAELFSRSPNSATLVMEANGYVTSTINIPFGDLTIFGGLLPSGMIRADVTMWVESSDG